jgi:hypothetical protein
MCRLSKSAVSLATFVLAFELFDAFFFVKLARGGHTKARGNQDARLGGIGTIFLALRSSSSDL